MLFDTPLDRSATILKSKVCQHTVKFAIAHPRKKIRWSPTHQKMPWCSPACRGKGWQLGRNFACSLFVALMTRLASMARFLPSVFISGLGSHFLSWFLNYSSQEQNIHPFTFTVSCKLRKLSKTLAFEVSLSLIKLLESPIPAPPPPPSQKASSDDISGTKRGTIDPLVSKRPEKILNKKIKNKKKT